MGKLVPRIAIIATLASSVLVPLDATAQAQAMLVVNATSQVAANVTSTMPLVRLHFTTPLSATKLPALKLTPALATRWQQISSRDVQAVAVGLPAPAVSYVIALPTSLRCALTCTVTATRVVQTRVDVNLTWEEQLLAQLNYLPVSFSPLTSPVSASNQVPGIFTWRFPSLAAPLSSLWSVGADNMILHGALMNFQNVHGLPTTGEIDPATWYALVNAANVHQVDPATYNFVEVSESSPETMTLYLNGVMKYQALVNTGIPQAPTALGTYPVYLRYTSQTMSGTNPDGTHYSDPGIPWVSYFNGGDALHGFLRSSYGYPQSLGCVEMPFASAAIVWPHTPIGTLVSVRA
jgi:peptidoglycan hydrolase-like protein with peptidoglycan-binding domain